MFQGSSVPKAVLLVFLIVIGFYREHSEILETFQDYRSITKGILALHTFRNDWSSLDG